MSPGPSPPTLVDVFCGCGGYSLGFTEEGFEVRAAVDKYRPSLETYAANVPAKLVLEADVRELEPGKDFEIAPDVLLGSPPCEAYTVANARRRVDPLSRLYNDKSGSMTVQFLKLLKEIKPRIFVMENVPQIMDGPLENELRMLFARVGFPVIHFNILHAEEHGTPSRRRRVFVSNIPIAPPQQPRVPTVGEVIGDIVDLDVDLPNHVELPIRGKRGHAMKELGEGESLYHYRAANGRVHSAWTRLRADSVAPTVKGLDRFIHPTQPRLLTAREHARLMGYPDDYVFHGSRNEVYNEIGESVPPPLSQAIAREVKRALDAMPETVQ